MMNGGNAKMGVVSMPSESANRAILRSILTDSSLPDEGKILRWLLSTPKSHGCSDVEIVKQVTCGSECLQQHDERRRCCGTQSNDLADALCHPWKDICSATTPEGFAETFLTFVHKEIVPYLEVQEASQPLTPPRTPEAAAHPKAPDACLSGRDSPFPAKELDLGRGIGGGGDDFRDRDCTNWKSGPLTQHHRGRGDAAQGSSKGDKGDLHAGKWDPGGGNKKGGYEIVEGEKTRGPLRLLGGDKEGTGRRVDGGRKHCGGGFDAVTGRVVTAVGRCAPVPLLSDEDEFPALGSNSPSPAKPMKNSLKQVPQKRIAPTPTRGPLVGSAFVIPKTETSLRLEMGSSAEPSKQASQSHHHNQAEAFLKVDAEALMNRRIHKKQHKRAGSFHKDALSPAESGEAGGVSHETGKEEGKTIPWRDDRMNAKLGESAKRANSVRRELLGCRAPETGCSEDYCCKDSTELQSQMDSQPLYAKVGLRSSPMKAVPESSTSASELVPQLVNGDATGRWGTTHTTTSCRSSTAATMSPSRYLSFNAEIESRLAKIQIDEAVLRNGDVSGRVAAGCGQEHNGKLSTCSSSRQLVTNRSSTQCADSAVPCARLTSCLESEEHCHIDHSPNPFCIKKKLGMSATTEDGKPAGFPVPHCVTGVEARSKEKKHANRAIQTRIAIVHGLLIQANLVPSITLELHVILRLLSLKPDCTVDRPPVIIMTFDANEGAEEQFGSPEGPRLGIFQSGDDCAAYACVVLKHSGRVPHCIGERVLSAFVEEPAIVKHSPELLAQLTASLAHYQTSALRSVKGYDSADASTNAGVAMESPARPHLAGSQENQSGTSPGGKATPQRGMPVPMSRPFDAARDSRLNFQTQEAQQLYNNREQCRDMFYELMREAAVGNMFEASSAFRGCTGLGISSSRGRGGVVSGGRYGSGGSVKVGGGSSSSGTTMGNGSLSWDEGYESFCWKVWHFLSWLRPENYTWFADLLLEQVIQVASTGEIDPEVTGLAGGNRAKLQRLHQRLTARGQTKVSGNSLALRPNCLGGSRSAHPATAEIAKGPGAEGPLVIQWTSAEGGSSRRLFGVLLDEPAKEDGPDNGAGGRWKKSRPHCGGKRIGEEADEDGSLLVDSSDLSYGCNFSFLQFFVEGHRIYALFLDVADSYRLNMHLMGSIEAKITSLSRFSPHSRDAAELGSNFTERVLGLKALASFLGYLTFSPLSALPPSVPGSDMSHLDMEVDPSLGVGNGFQSGLLKGMPPLDMLGVLQDAAEQQSLVLTLPWVLEFLKMMKGIGVGMLPPYYHQLFLYLWSLYRLPLLQPIHPKFGVGSLCIAAQLDGFFSFMGVSRGLPSDASSTIECSLRRSNSRRNCDGKGHMMPCGLDDLEGLIDNRYIQNCCPLVMDLHTILMRGKETRGSSPSPSPQRNIQQMRRLRKIRPVRPHQVLPAASTEDPDASVIAEFADFTEENPVKLKLQRAFLEQHPHLRRLVDFAVDTVAVNSALAAAMKVLPQALPEASAKLENAILSAVGQLESQEDGCCAKAALQLDASIDDIIEDTIASSIPKALEYALEHSKDRASEALAALVAPDETDQRVGVAAAIAGETAGRAACQRVLVGLPRDIRRRIAEEAEAQKRKVLPSLIDKWLGAVPGVEANEQEEASEKTALVK